LRRKAETQRVDPPSIAAAIYGDSMWLRVERKRKSETSPAVVQISWLRILASDVF
jgi:hypothetical protein